jgi:hypothetical protein
VSGVNANYMIGGNKDTLKTFPEAAISLAGGAYGTFVIGDGTVQPSALFGWAPSGLNQFPDVTMNGGKWIGFTASVGADTKLKAKAGTPGTLTVNDVDILTAVTTREGAEVGLAEALDMIDDLKARMAALEARLPREA